MPLASRSFFGRFLFARLVCAFKLFFATFSGIILKPLPTYPSMPPPLVFIPELFYFAHCWFFFSLTHLVSPSRFSLFLSSFFFFFLFFLVPSRQRDARDRHQQQPLLPVSPSLSNFSSSYITCLFFYSVFFRFSLPLCNLLWIFFLSSHRLFVYFIIMRTERKEQWRVLVLDEARNQRARELSKPHSESWRSFRLRNGFSCTTSSTLDILLTRLFIRGVK